MTGATGVDSHWNLRLAMRILQRNGLDGPSRSPRVQIFDLGAGRHRDDLLLEEIARVAHIHT